MSNLGTSRYDVETTFTEEERTNFLYTLQPIDSFEIAEYIAENFPEMFDAAAAQVIRVRNNMRAKGEAA